ncbi:MAG TPA: hypothetical protein VJA16_19875 [Thermoanaerobaculia bacterium]
MASRPSLSVLVVGVLAVLGWSRGAAPPSGAPSSAASSQPAAAGRGQPEREGAAAAASAVHSGRRVAANARPRKGRDSRQADGARPGDGKDDAGCPAKPRDAASGEAAARAPWCEPLRLYDEFLGLPPVEDLDRQTAIQRVRDATRPVATQGGAAPAQGYQLQFLVALVPDPLDSQLPAAFDQAIDAIQQGFAYSNRTRTGYLQDRSWIPWNDPQAIKEESYRTSPGLLLFRRFGRQAGLTGRVPQLMGVFLVGETPKTGIHKAAFAEALRLIGELSSGADQGPLRILGPTYSGSAVSLRVALQTWLAEHQGKAPAPAEIVTGSATAPCLEKTLRLAAPAAVSFYRAVVPLDVLLETAFDELHRRLGWDLHRVLLITELDTAFGQSIRQRDAPSGEAVRKNGARDVPGRDTPRRDISSGAAAEGSAECQAVPIRAGVAVLSFPSHISAIRTARAAAGLDKAQPDPSQIAPQPARSDLQLDLSDRRLGVDLVPEFSPLTAPDNELAIASLVDAIARDGVRYVGIVATDVRDTLFLADRLRSQARNVTLFALDADQLFLHPQVHSALSGMTVISSSPLFTTGKSWGQGAAAQGDSPWHFTSSFENGIYQATVELLGDAALDPFAHNDAGPVWISVVGNDALWPVHGVTAAPDPGQGAADEPELVVAFEEMVRSEQAEPADLARPLAVASSSAKADLDLLCFAAALCAGGWWLYRAALLPAPPSGARAERGTRVLLAAGLAILALAAAVLLVVSGLALWNRFYASPLDLALDLRQGVGFFALLGAYVLLVGAVCAALVGRRAVGAMPGGAQESVAGGVDAGRAAAGEAAGEATRWRRWLPAAGRATRWRLVLPAGAASLAGAAAPPLLAWLICRRWLLCGEDFDQRVRAFASGLSPLVSLAWLVGASFLWALLELKRRRLTAWQQIDWPVQDAFEPAFTGCSRLLGMIRWLLAAGVARSWWRWLALAALVVAPLCLVWHPMQPAAEPREVGRLMLVLWTLPAVLSAISCYRFVRVWRTLRKLLVRIESTPIAARLGQLSGELHWKPMQAFSWPIPPFETLILSLVKIKQLAKRRLLTLTDAQRESLDGVLGLAFDADTRGDATREISSREELAGLIADFGGQLAQLRGNQRVEDFFAIRVAAYLRYVFAQLRNSLMSALAPALLVLVAASAYTFEPKGAVSLGLLALAAAEIFVAISVFVAMNRDTVLSLIAGNRPGEVTFDWHFVSSLLTFGLVPLLGLIGTQVPAAGQLLNGWLKPLMRLAGVG